MEQPQNTPFVMSLESKRRAIAKSHFKTDPQIKPKKFSKRKTQFKQFLKDHRKAGDLPTITFEYWYMLMGMPCECDETKVWDYNKMTISVVVKKINKELAICDANATRKCAKCRQGSN